MSSRKASISTTRSTTGKSPTPDPSKSSSSSSRTPETSDDDYEGKDPSQIERRLGALEQKKEPSYRSPSSPTSVSIERRDSSSSASDIPSDHDEDEPQDRRNYDKSERHHKLPLGWSCNYDPETDEYNFELDQKKQDQKSSLLQGNEFQRFGRSPTTDHTVQTSRRPTYHVYECRYGYHFPSSPTSSMISELAKEVQKSSAPQAAAKQTAAKSRLVGYGKTKLAIPTEEEAQLRRLRDMFPTATELVIEHMIRVYHGREGLIKAALISLGFKRSKEYNTQQATAQSPIMLMMSKPASKKLFDKLRGYFPDKDETIIKNLMYKHKEIEHEIISALVEDGRGNVETASDRHRRTIAGITEREATEATKRTKNGAIMKLRYLKFLYPSCDEIELYHLLHCNDLNAEKVMEIVEKRGHKQANIDEVMQKRKSQTQQMRAQQVAHAAKDKPPSAAQELVEAHKKRVRPSAAAGRIESSKINLKKKFDDYDEGLLMVALEAADYNEDLARKFLDEMGPIDESSYLQRYKLPTSDSDSNFVAFPCKAIQKDGSNFMSMLANDFVHIPRDVIRCQHALALLKVDASTFTGEDFSYVRPTHRQGHQSYLREGSKYAGLLSERSYMIKKVTDRKSSKHGSQYDQICVSQQRPRPNSLAVGRSKDLARGRNVSLNSGRNPNLLKRVHPFFQETKVIN